MVPKATAERPADAEDASTVVLSESEAIRQFARHLTSLSWCVNVSTGTTMLFHADTGVSANLEDLRLSFPRWARDKRIEVKFAPRGDDKDPYEEFLSSLRFRVPRHLERMHGRTFRPVPQKFVEMGGATFANTYVPFRPDEPADTNVDRALALLRRALPDEVERKLCLQWMAHIVQRPVERPQWGLLITGEGGAGKSLMFKMIAAALGNRHVYQDDDFRVVNGQFSQTVPDSLLVCLDDAKLPKDAAERLKNPMTNPYQNVEVKGVQGQQKREVYARFAVCSNDPNPLHLVNDRRWLCPAPCKAYPDSPEFGRDFDAWLQEPDTPAKLHHWLMSIDLSDFDTSRCPRTETALAMEAAGTTQLERHLIDFLAEHDQPIFHQATVIDYLEAEGMRFVKADELARALEGLAYNSKRRPFAVEGKPTPKHVWVWQPVGTRSRSLRPEEEEAIRGAARLSGGSF